MIQPGGQPVLSEPHHNTMVLLPFRSEIFHGVTPIKSETFVRHAMAVHFMKADGSSTNYYGDN